MADFSKLLIYFNKEALSNFVNSTILDELSTLMYRVQQDSEIPREYKDSLILWSSTEEGRVYLTAYIPEKMKWKRFGRSMVSERYRCPLEDTLILTPMGLVKANDLKQGSKLIGRESINEIIDIMREYYNGNVQEIRVQYFPPFRVTPNHSFLVAKRIWKYIDHGKSGMEYIGPTFRYNIKKASDIRVGDYLIFPKITIENDVYFNVKEIKLKLTYGLARLFGWYLAEGWCTKRQVSWSLGKSELDEIEEIKVLIKTELGLEPKFYEARTASVVYFNSTKYARLFNILFGTGAKRKHVPNNLLSWKRDILKGFLDAYEEGDGWSNNYRHRVSSSNKSLILQLQIAYWKLGIYAGYTKCFNKGKKIEGRSIPDSIEYILQYIEGRRRKMVYDLDFGYAVRVTTNRVVHYEGKQIIIQTSDGSIQLPFYSKNCPIHKYFGGELTPEYTGPDYIKQKFEEDKPRIINNIRSKIMEYLRGM